MSMSHGAHFENHDLKENVVLGFLLSDNKQKLQ